MENNVNEKRINIIEIKWEGPIELNDILKKENSYEDNTSKDYGIYQLYGHHYMYGSDTLLYIGKAAKRTFRSRFQFHDNWIKEEASDIKIYLGRMGGIQSQMEKEVADRINFWDENKLNREYDDFYQYWEKCINNAEKLMIYFCTPPYNGANVGYYDLDSIKNTILLNFGKRNKLPAVFTSLYKESSFWPKVDETGVQKDSEWDLFKWQEDKSE